MANETREKLSDEVVNRALVIASRGKPVGAGDGDTYVMHVPTLQTMRAALEFALRAAESPSPSVAEAVDAGLHETLDMNSRALVTYRALLEKAAETLQLYADTFCEAPSSEVCGKFNDNRCSGCRARATLASIREALGKGREG